MNLDELLNESTVSDAQLGAEALADGEHELMIKPKKDGSSPFKAFVSERSNARGGQIAEVGVYMTPVDGKSSGEYFKLGLAGILEGTSKAGKDYQINIGTNASSVAALLSACGITDGNPAVADPNTGQALALSSLEVKSKDNPSVEGTEVHIANSVSGDLTSLNEQIYATTFRAVVSTRESEYNGKIYKNREVKFVK